MLSSLRALSARAGICREWQLLFCATSNIPPIYAFQTPFNPSCSIRPTRGLQAKVRFWKTVVVQQAKDGYQLLLDANPIITPAKQHLVLPTYQLALAVAAEWEWQATGRLQMLSMPLMTLAATAIDQILDPILKWVRKELGWDLHTTHSIAGTTQPEATVQAAQKLLEGLDCWELAAVEQLTAATKSLVLSMATMKNHLTVPQVITAARLEEDFQIEDWGKVEAGHDLDIVDTNTRITSASLFIRLLRADGPTAPLPVQRPE